MDALSGTRSKGHANFVRIKNGGLLIGLAMVYD